ncbi:MAG: hypothetical protein MI892_09815 [Desulfobacterales bacterium]|nr:hypothetical protein [Desulfobacterales bacterium]
MFAWSEYPAMIQVGVSVKVFPVVLTGNTAAVRMVICPEPILPDATSPPTRTTA